MLEKIISGGQTGADRAALDVALKFRIDHGGWIPKGRLTESGPLAVKYLLAEMPTQDYRERTRQNIIDSHGTLIVSRGKLTGGSKLTESFARVMGRPLCCIDLLDTEEFEAAVILKSFVLENAIETLNVAGPRLSRQPLIYQDVKTILEVLLYLLFLDTGKDRDMKARLPLEPFAPAFPGTIGAAVDLIRHDLPLETRIFIARMEPKDIHMLYFTFLDYIRSRVGFDTENQALLIACRSGMGDVEATIEDGVMEILKQLKQDLETDHILRVVK